MARCTECLHYNVCYKKPIRNVDEDLVVIGGCSDYKPTADVVEVPCRCKDCRYSEVTDNGRFHNKIYCFQPAPIKQIVETEEERFCSYGERKE